MFGFDSVRAYVSDNYGKVVFSVGALLLLIGVVTLNMYGSVLSAGSFFFGILFVVYGLFVQAGVLSGNLLSLTGIGTILVCVSIALLAFSFALVQFVDVTPTGVIRQILPHGGGPTGEYKLNFISTHPFSWLSDLSLEVGIVLLIVGSIFKTIYALTSSRS
jgi:hypothetical protein